MTGSLAGTYEVPSALERLLGCVFSPTSPSLLPPDTDTDTTSQPAGLRLSSQLPGTKRDSPSLAQPYAAQPWRFEAPAAVICAGVLYCSSRNCIGFYVHWVLTGSLPRGARKRGICLYVTWQSASCDRFRSICLTAMSPPFLAYSNTTMAPIQLLI